MVKSFIILRVPMQLDLEVDIEGREVFLLGNGLNYCEPVWKCFTLRETKFLYLVELDHIWIVIALFRLVCIIKINRRSEDSVQVWLLKQKPIQGGPREKF